jgi:hypothetical protein
VFRSNLKVPAECSGDKIAVSADWLRNHPDDLGLFTHELTHVVQSYPDSNPGWLTEGLADYARYLYGPQEQPGWTLPRRLSPKQSYKDGYGTTARFLLWLDNRHPGIVDKLNRRMQEREFKVADFKTLTDLDIDALWGTCVAELGPNR